jgi:hypothetical protein
LSYTAKSSILYKIFVKINKCKLPKNQKTDANGQAVFTIKAKGKTGVATITFSDGSLSTQVTVTK